MKVFISWSGERSRDVATALGDWLPQVLHAVDPFVSTRDLAAGGRWTIELAERLEKTDFGIVCITQENQLAPWLNYEAGAIAKAMAASRVVPLAIDLAPIDILKPLGEFQGTQANKDGFAKIVKSMNEVCSSPISETHLNRAFDKWWPELGSELEKIENRPYESDPTTSPSPRDERAILEEVLTTVRGLAQRPYLTSPDQPNGSPGINDDIGEILRSSGISSWRIISSLDKVEVSPREPISAHVMEQLALLGKIRNVDIQVENPDLPEMT